MNSIWSIFCCNYLPPPPLPLPPPPLPQMFSACGVDDSYTTLIDQLVSIVQHILETKVDGALEHLAHVKIDNIVLNFVMYVRP